MLLNNSYLTTFVIIVLIVHINILMAQLNASCSLLPISSELKLLIYFSTPEIAHCYCSVLWRSEWYLERRGGRDLLQLSVSVCTVVPARPGEGKF